MFSLFSLNSTLYCLFQDVIKQTQALPTFGEYVVFKRSQNKLTSLREGARVFFPPFVSRIFWIPRIRYYRDKRGEVSYLNFVPFES
jgi:hypothetical protein